MPSLPPDFRPSNVISLPPAKKSAQLDTVFEHLGEFWNRELEMRQGLIRPLYYPLTVLHFAVLVWGVLDATTSSVTEAIVYTNPALRGALRGLDLSSTRWCGSRGRARRCGAFGSGFQSSATRSRRRMPSAGSPPCASNSARGFRCRAQWAMRGALPALWAAIFGRGGRGADAPGRGALETGNAVETVAARLGRFYRDGGTFRCVRGGVQKAGIGSRAVLETGAGTDGGMAAEDRLFCRAGHGGGAGRATGLPGEIAPIIDAEKQIDSIGK